MRLEEYAIRVRVNDKSTDLVFFQAYYHFKHNSKWYVRMSTYTYLSTFNLSYIDWFERDTNNTVYKYNNCNKWSKRFFRFHVSIPVKPEIEHEFLKQLSCN